MSAKQPSNGIHLPSGRANSLIIPRPSVQQHRVIRNSLVSVSYDQNSTQQHSKPRSPLIPLLNCGTIAQRHSFDSKLDAMQSSGLPKIDRGNSNITNISRDSEHYLSGGGGGGSSKSVGSGSARDEQSSENKEFMRLRIRELEKEVTKLTNHIQQAELSIKNYRGVLSSKSPRGNNKKDCAVQTDADEATKLRQALKIAQDKLQALTNEYISMKSAKDEVFKERSGLQELGRKKEEALHLTITRHEYTIKTLQTQVKDLESLMTKGNGSIGAPDKAEVDSGLLASKIMRSRWVAEQIRGEVLAAKAEIPSLLLDMKKSITEQYREIISRLTSTLQAESSKNAEKDRLLNDLAGAERKKEVDLLHLHQALVDSQTEVSRLQSANEVLQLEQAAIRGKLQAAEIAAASVTSTAVTSPSTPEGSPPAVATAVSTASVGLSPVKALLLTPVKPPCTSATSYKDSTCSPLSPLKNARTVLEQQQPTQQQQQQQQVHDARMRQQLTEQLKKQQQESSAVLRRVNEQRQQEQRRVEDLLQQLQHASEALAELRDVHAAELKAVKHTAHVKDLARIGKEREAAIEKDRMSIEIKHLREVQNVLNFSLSTAEQSLMDVLPHVVVKLSQGRTKRMKLLEHELRGRLKDVEQRSADTCAVSSQHLEAFQTKAERNSLLAMEMTHAAVEKMKRLLAGELAGAAASGGGGSNGSGGAAGGAAAGCSGGDAAAGISPYGAASKFSTIAAARIESSALAARESNVLR